MDRREAANEAWLALEDWAEYNDWRHGDVLEVDLTRRDCYRFSRHRFDCDGSVDFAEGFCQATVRVRYASRTSYRIRTRVHNVKCF